MHGAPPNSNVTNMDRMGVFFLGGGMTDIMLRCPIQAVPSNPLRLYSLEESIHDRAKYCFALYITLFIWWSLK
jgi:hypothetical protein